MLDDSQGQPAFYPTLFITSQVRGANKATATTEQYLYAIKVLYRVCEKYSIDLVSRITSLEFLSTRELDEIRDECKRGKSRHVNSSVVSLKKGYRPIEKSVSSATQYIYLTHIASFLKWLCQHLLAAKRFNRETADRVSALNTAVLARRPQLSAANVDREAEKGITKTQEIKLFQVLQPNSPENPFVRLDVQVRNYLIVKLMRALGPRRGEVLNVQIGDLDLQRNTIKIVRRADSKADYRPRQPLAKTRPRELILSQSLMDELRYYIVHVRKRIPNSSRHPYLFVTHKSGPTQGHPLSISGQQEIFREIGNRHPDLNLHAHMLRHTWNERYSETMEGSSTHSHAEIEQWRNLLQGWTPTSKMGAIYNAKHIQRKAHEASLMAQKTLEEKIAVARSLAVNTKEYEGKE